MIETIAAVHPITAIAAADDATSLLLFVGSGGQVTCYRTLYGDDRTVTTSVALFLSDTVHGIKIFCGSVFHTLSSSSSSSCSSSSSNSHRRNEDMLVVYGGKAIGLVCPLTSMSNDGSIRLHVETILDNLDDMVLDCELLMPDASISQSYRTLLVGYAHNFVDLIDVSVSQNTITTAAKYHRRFRVQCPELSVLFSMTIDMGVQRSDNHCVSICSGTAFGKIIVWSIDLSTVQQAANQTTSDQEGAIIHQESMIHPLPSVRTLMSWTEHEGVIFKMRWSTDRQRLASVSDDRTVRIWDMTQVPCKALYVGWGHVSRLWDVLFLPGPDGRETWVATASEDGTIRIWDVTRGMEDAAIAVLRGHSSHIWCIAAINVGPNVDRNTLTTTMTTTATTTARGQSSVDNRNKSTHTHTHEKSPISHVDPPMTTMTTTTTSTMVIFSGGNDGSIKSWPLLPHIIASALKTESALIGVPVPMAPASTPPLGSSNAPIMTSTPSVATIMTSSPSAVQSLLTTSVGEGIEAFKTSSSCSSSTTELSKSTPPPLSAPTTTTTTLPATSLDDETNANELVLASKPPVVSRRSNAVSTFQNPISYLNPNLDPKRITPNLNP